MNELISIIVPVYNSEKYIEKCITTITSSTYSNLEVILIDDGSNDGSGQICDKIKKSDNRISVIHQSNHGVSYTRNLGIKLANGTYIAFIDSDDTISIDYFEKLLKCLETNKADLSICTVAHMRGSQIQRDALGSIIIDFEKIDIDSKENFLELNKKYYLYGPVNKLYKTEIIKKNKVEFPIDTSYGEDLLFNFKYLEYCRVIAYTEGGVYYYNHDNEVSLSHKYRENIFENGLRLNLCMEDFCVRHDLFDEFMCRYIAERIFDDTYNSIFVFWDKQCCLNVKVKYQKVRSIMNNAKVKEIIRFADTQKYKRWVCKLIEKRQAFLFTAIMQIYKLCRNI